MSPGARPFTPDRVEAALARCPTMESLAGAVFAALRPEVPFDFACLATTDPLTGVITYAYKSHPLEMGDEAFTAAEYGGPDVNLFAEIAQRPVPVGVLSQDTDGHPERCARFRNFLAPPARVSPTRCGWSTGRGLTWGALGLYRGPGEAPFAKQDVERLAAVREIIAHAVRRTLFAASPGDDDQVPEPAV